jgi:hypothetical protein
MSHRRENESVEHRVEAEERKERMRQEITFVWKGWYVGKASGDAGCLFNPSSRDTE